MQFLLPRDVLPRSRLLCPLTSMPSSLLLFALFRISRLASSKMLIFYSGNVS
jgi:hypothetical protein